MKEDFNEHISWCMKQKRGIKLQEINQNLCDVYLKKAKSALNMLNSAEEKKEVDWIATTAYYARYFAFYAFLQKCGIKSEIHDCSVSLLYLLLVEEGYLDKKHYKDFFSAKELRVEIQYYVALELDKEKLKNSSETAGPFVLKIEEIIDKITTKEIEFLRNKVKNILKEKYDK